MHSRTSLVQHLRPFDLLAQIGVQIVQSMASGEDEVRSLDPQYDQALRRAVRTAGTIGSEIRDAAGRRIGRWDPHAQGRGHQADVQARRALHGSARFADGSPAIVETATGSGTVWYVMNHGGAAVDITLSLPMAARSLKDLRPGVSLPPGGLITLDAGETRLIAIEPESRP